MKTIEDKLIGHDVDELLNRTEDVLNDIQNYLNEHTDVFTLTHILDVNLIRKSLKRELVDMGICDRRRLRRALNKCLVKKTWKSYNLFLYLMCKNILKLDVVPKLISSKHELIQKKRKEWKEYQAEADRSLKEYKEIKSDFYKMNQGIF